MKVKAYIKKHYSKTTYDCVNAKLSKPIVKFINLFYEVDDEGFIISKESGSCVEHVTNFAYGVAVGLDTWLTFMYKHDIHDVLAYRDFRKTMKKNRNGCCGFSEKEQKWYGWTHRGIRCFGVGDSYFNYLRGKGAKNLDECKQLAFYAIQELT